MNRFVKRQPVAALLIAALCALSVPASADVVTEWNQKAAETVVAAKLGTPVAKVHNALMDLEELDQERLDSFRAKYEKLAAAARKDLDRGFKDTDSPEP